MTPNEVSGVWRDVFRDPRSSVTVRKMMEAGYFRDQGITTVLYDGSKWRVDRDEFLVVMLRNTAGVLARMMTRVEERGMDPREAMMGAMDSWTDAELAGAHAALMSALNARKGRGKK
jgi:hypothetical protein